MEYTRERLLEESVHFIDLCQSYCMEGKIDVDTYNTLIGIKIYFIRDVLRDAKILTSLSEDLAQKIESIKKLDKKINNANKANTCLRDCCV